MPITASARCCACASERFRSCSADRRKIAESSYAGSGQENFRRARGGACRLPARLPRHLCHEDHRRERHRGESGGRERPSVHLGHALHQGGAVSGAHLQQGPRALPAQENRSQRPGRVRAHFLGRGARYDRRKVPRDRGRGSTGHPPLRLRGHHGLRAVALAGKAGMLITLGGSLGMDPERFDEAKLILIWGSNPIVSNLHLWSRVQEAKRRGAKLVAIDPYRSLSAEKCHEHLALLPGTDAALALGMMHVIIGEGRHDADYVEKYTIGFAALARRVKEYPPRRVAEITGLPAEKIISLAREYAATRPAAIRLNYGLQRHAGGGMAVRNILCLPALTGDWRHPAGGAVLSTSGFFGMNDAKLERPDLLLKARNANPRTINMVAIGDALLEAKPPIRALYVYNSNPVAVAPDSAKVVKGFSREDLFTVVHEQFLTDTCDYADIVLPATTQLEHHDVHTAYGHLYVVANSPAIAPLGESLPNSEAFRRLAARMGFAEECFRDSDEDICRQALESSNPRMQGIEWDSLKEKGWQRLNVPERFAPFAQGNFGTPSGKCEFYSETAMGLGMDPLPTYIPPRESAQSSPALAGRYPLAIISPPNRHFLNSSFANMPFAIAEAGEPSLEIHPGDAAARGIANGDAVRIFNDRGSLTARARVSDKAREGVVVALSVWWRKLTADRKNANELTSQALTDIGGELSPPH